MDHCRSEQLTYTMIGEMAFQLGDFGTYSLRPKMVNFKITTGVQAHHVLQVALAEGGRRTCYMYYVFNLISDFLML